MRKLIFFLFATLLFFVPLVLWPFTSEVFEFNKMVSVYALTVLIISAWLVRTILTGKIIFRRTLLDTPLLIFIGTQLVSTILSIDPLTSWLGYYSRFNGGLASTICYSLLYWAWVSNFSAKETLKLVYVWLASAVLVSVYGVLEHLGIDKSVWVQDVQSRIFSTLGQPNWLAAWVVALIPITWGLSLKEKFMSKGFWIYFSLSVLFFWTLIFTKSRSGILGFGVAFLTFWGGYFWLNLKEYQRHLNLFGVVASSLFIICLISGTQFTPSLGQLLQKQSAINNQQSTIAPAGTALETGGTESGTIRKIVWTGALQVWLHYPIFGTGVETFAYSYYKFRPAEHNLVSEWDFIYNKAHNEFLNIAANTGTVGLIAYLVLIGFSLYIFIHEARIGKQESGSKTHDSLFMIHYSLLAGYASLLATNFFGFSVVPTQLQLFLFPAIAIGMSESGIKNQESRMQKTSNAQKLAVFFTLILASCFIFQISRYWYSDILYTKGKAYISISRPDLASNYLTRAIRFEPNQSIFHSELANTYKNLALSFYQQKNMNNTKKFTDLAISESARAVVLSPANLNLKRSLFGVYISLATINPNYLVNAGNALAEAIKGAPTDAKLYYNLGLVYARTGQSDSALLALKKTIELKANYKEARLAYAILLIDKKQNAEAKAQLTYILTNIDPNDSLTKQTLESIK